MKEALQELEKSQLDLNEALNKEREPEPIAVKDFLDEVAEEMKAIAKSGQRILVEWSNDV